MCTATWLTADERLHLFFNRDELRTREPARPPSRFERGGVSYLAPTDGRAGGTWIAATSLGSALALLNKSGGQPPASPKSRGSIIPALVDSGGPRALARSLEALSLDRFSPFRLLALWRTPANGVALAWDGEELSTERLDPGLGFLASSGLGDERATRTRGELWRRRRATAKRWSVERHRAFHRDHSPRRGAWSVCVHREDASTVSYAEIELGRGAIGLTYFEGSPCSAPRPSRIELAAPAD